MANIFADDTNIYISKIIVGASEYNLKDARARDEINTLADQISALGSPMHFKGVLPSLPATTSGYKDGDVISISSSDLSYEYNHKEFVCSGDSWVEFGDTSYLGALASKNSATGTISIPNLIQAATVTVSGTVNMDTYTPSGTVSQPTFTGTKSTVSINVAAATHNVVFSTTAASSAGDLAIVQNIDNPTWDGTSSTFSGTFTPSGTIDIALAAPNLTKTTATRQIVTATKSETHIIGMVNGEILTLTASIEEPRYTITNEPITYVTDVAAPNVTTATFTGNSGTLSVSGIPQGSIKQGTVTTIYAHGLVNVGDINTEVEFTPIGTVSQPTFTGAVATLSGTYNTSVTHSHTFTETTKTVTVS